MRAAVVSARYAARWAGSLVLVAAFTLVPAAAFCADAPAPAPAPAPPAGETPAPGIGTLVAGEGPLHFTSFLLKLPGKIKLTFYEDVNGDSLTDIVAVYGSRRENDPARNLVVFFQRRDGFRAEPDIRYRIPDDVILIDLGDVVPDSPGAELLLLTGDGVSWLPLAPPDASAGPRTLEGAGTRLVAVHPAFAHADPLGVDQRDFARPVGHDTRATLFIPVTDGYNVYYPDDHYAVAQELAAPHLHEVGDNLYTVHVADIRLADVNGDGRPDLAISYLDELRVFYAEGGRFHDRPDLDLALGIITGDDRENPNGLAGLVGFQLADVNGDSLADIFVWKRVIAKKAVINDKQQYQIFLNRGGRFEPVPDQAFILRSLESQPELRDLNGDGRPDLHTGTMDLSLANLMKILVTGRVSVDLNFFLGGPGGFPDQPSETRSFRIKLSFSNLDEFFVPAVEVDGDYNGDGVRDFLLQTADAEVEIYLGKRGGEGLYEKHASVRLETAASPHDFVKDMNGDGRDDIAFDRFPDRKPFDRGWINVLLSR